MASSRHIYLEQRLFALLFQEEELLNVQEGWQNVGHGVDPNDDPLDFNGDIWDKVVLKPQLFIWQLATSKKQCQQNPTNMFWAHSD